MKNLVNLPLGLLLLARRALYAINVIFMIMAVYRLFHLDTPDEYKSLGGLLFMIGFLSPVVYVLRRVMQWVCMKVHGHPMRKLDRPFAF